MGSIPAQGTQMVGVKNISYETLTQNLLHPYLVYANIKAMNARVPPSPWRSSFNQTTMLLQGLALQEHFHYGA